MSAATNQERVEIGRISFKPHLFWAKVNKTEGCWLWTGTNSGSGYGWFGIKLDGKPSGGMPHRISYALSNGPIPEGMQIDHRCHNKLCVNPQHLRLATNKQNSENLIAPISNNTSGVRGVFSNPKSASNPWRAAVGHNGRQVHVGSFPTREAAEAAVVTKRLELHTHNDADRRTA